MKSKERPDFQHMETSVRVALCVGCNVYESDAASNLEAAELDARRMFAALTDAALGAYDLSRSRLLLSPTLQELRDSLYEALFGTAQPIESFTFFFAGHGKVSAGSFYMWVRDTKFEAQSVSAFSLSDLFRSINEATAAQSNIIIDACESGGLIKDLGTLLNKDGLGDAASGAITLFATSAKDQSSGEGSGGGLGTVALLDCIEGRDFVQDRTPTLDLVEIGRRVSERFVGTEQSPVVWGLNLLQAPRFSLNPRFRTDPAKPFRDAVTGWRATMLQKNVYEDLWRAYTSTSSTWTSSSFLKLVRPALTDSGVPADLRADLAVRIAASMSERAREASDQFRSTQISAAIAVCLLADLEHAGVADAVGRIHRYTIDSGIHAIETLLFELRRDPFCLVRGAQGGPLGELYFVPHRVSDVLGWAGLLASEEPTPATKAQFEELLSLLSLHYGGSEVALSDRQAPFAAIALAATQKLGLVDQGEELAGRLFHSLVKFGGKIAPVELAGREVLSFLLQRAANNFEAASDVLQTPIQLATVLFKAATDFGLGEVFDDSLWKLDGLSLYAYIPDSFRDYGAASMHGGANIVWTIGHDLFRVADVDAGWPTRAASPGTALEKALASFASLLMPNRVAWFWFPDRATAPQSPALPTSASSKDIQ